MNKKIYMIRHCEAKGQPPESVLTVKGHDQAGELADFFSGIQIDRIISSPFVRARQTIEPIANRKGVSIELDERLSERILSSKPLDDWIDKLKATYTDLELTFEGGESSKEAMNRIVAVVADVVDDEAENTIIVTHGNIMSLLLHYYDKNFGFEEWKKLSNPDVFLLEFTGEDCTIRRIW